MRLSDLEKELLAALSEAIKSGGTDEHARLIYRIRKELIHEGHRD